MPLSSTSALAGLLGEDVKLKLGIKRVRGDTFGYLQRSFIGSVCDVDQREPREAGEKVVQFAMCCHLGAVAGKTRVMGDELIAPGGSEVTDIFRKYMRPLLGSGMPDAVRLRHHLVAKVLRDEG